MMGLHENCDLTTFLALKHPVLDFLNFLSSRPLLSYNPLSYKTTCSHLVSQKKQHDSQLVNPFLEKVNLECSSRIDKCQQMVFQ